MKKRNNSGLTIVESLVGLALLSIVMSSSLAIMKDIYIWQKRVEISLDYSSLRTQVMNQISDYRSWPNNVLAAGNTQLGCYKNQNTTTASDRNCSTLNGAIDIYDYSNQKTYDFQNASFGFSLTGEPCTTFNPVAGSGDPNCPLKINLTAKSLCANADCVNPLLKISGQFVYNGNKDYSNIRVSNMDFTVYKSNIYCPAQPTPIALNTFLTVNLIGANQVVSTVAGKNSSAGYAESSVNLVPCRNVSIKFNNDLAASVPGGLTLADAENTSNVCLYDPDSGKCVFTSEYTYDSVGSVYTYKLSYDPPSGTKSSVAQKPSWLTISGTSQAEFQVVNGLVKFCIDGQCLHYFEGKLDFPFKVRFQPAGSDYSPNGINSISITTSDL